MFHFPYNIRKWDEDEREYKEVESERGASFLVTRSDRFIVDLDAVDVADGATIWIAG